MRKWIQKGNSFDEDERAPVREMQLRLGTSLKIFVKVTKRKHEISEAVAASIRWATFTKCRPADQERV